MKNNNFGNQEIKVFLKVKSDKIKKQEQNKNYCTINKDKKSIDYVETKPNMNKTPTTFYYEKIFTDEENSYIYEEICRNITNLTNTNEKKPKNFFTLSYGFPHTGRKSSIFGKQDSDKNLNSWGLAYRFIQEISKKIDSNKMSLQYSFYCINENKFLDVNSLKHLELSEITDLNDIFQKLKIIDKNTDFNKLLRKDPLNILQIGFHF
jgi:hypothetical protein